MHYGLLHILFNMVILYRFGEMLETALGRVRLVALYLAALLCGSFGALLLTPHALTGGASGAVFGRWRRPPSASTSGASTCGESGVGGLIVLNLVLTFVVGGISIGGHLGGSPAASVGGFMLHRGPPQGRDRGCGGGRRGGRGGSRRVRVGRGPLIG